MRQSRTFSHIWLSVPNLEKAVDFYSKVMWWYIVMKPTLIKEETDSAIWIMCEDVFWKWYDNFRIAHLVTADWIGIELFEFKQNNSDAPKFNHIPTWMFHFCIQDPDIEGIVKVIVENGWKQRMPIREYYPWEKPYKMCYVEDPFGIVFEVYTHSYEVTYSAWAY
jgi:lactoylglutathione lyase family protein